LELGVDLLFFAKVVPVILKSIWAVEVEFLLVREDH
jgi:hypothetical protein